MTKINYKTFLDVVKLNCIIIMMVVCRNKMRVSTSLIEFKRRLLSEKKIKKNK